MHQVPEVKAGNVNEVLQPYFLRIEAELNKLPPAAREIKIKQYQSHIESVAQKARWAVRMQLRINLRTLLTKFDVLSEKTEPNVKPTHEEKLDLNPGDWDGYKLVVLKK